MGILGGNIIMNDLVSKYDVLHLLYTIFEKYSMATDKTDILGGFGKEVFDIIKAMPTINNTNKENKMESITSNSIGRVTKKELIQAINRTFPDDDVIKDNYVIAVVTEVSCHYNEPTLQSIQFGKKLEF